MNPLSWILQFTFGCRHRHMSRVFTIKRRTYRVCFDCGREFDLPGVDVPGRPGGSAKTVRVTNPVLHSDAPRFETVSQRSQS